MTKLISIKDEIREVARESICRMTSAARAAASDRIQYALLRLPEYTEASSVFTYLSFGNEINTDRIFSDVLSSGKRLFVPLFVDGAYRLIEYRDGDALHVGYYGIREPDLAEEALPDDLFVVMPGLAFDRKCHRLGRGAGFYDRIMHRLSSGGVTIFAAGLTYSNTLYDDVPVESYDFDVDVVVTENEAVRRPV